MNHQNHTISQQISKHFRDLYFGGNWTDSNIKDQLKDLNWKDATTQLYNLNTIVTLTYHIHYFVRVVLKVLQNGVLDGNDKLSFDHPPINSHEDWDQFLNEIWTEADTFFQLVEQIPDQQLWDIFYQEKYGNYYRNFHGIIEHSHYHLGQIALIKKILATKNR